MKINYLILFALIFKTSKNFQQEKSDFEYLNSDLQDKLFLNQTLLNLKNLISNKKDKELVNTQNLIIQKEDQTTSNQIIDKKMNNQIRQKFHYKNDENIDNYQAKGLNQDIYKKDYLFGKRNLQYSYYSSQNQKSASSSSSSSNQQSKSTRTPVCRTKNGCYTDGAIAGIAIGAFCGAACIGLNIFCMCRSCKRKQQEIQKMQNMENATDVKDNNMIYPEGFNPNIPPPQFPPGYSLNTDLSYLHNPVQTSYAQERNNLIYPERLNFYNQSLPSDYLSNVELQQYLSANKQIINSAPQQAGINQQNVFSYPQNQAQGPNFFNVPQQFAHPQEKTIQIQNDEQRLKLNQVN